MGSDAEEFNEKLGSFKEFSNGNGGHYLMMQFEDDSGLVFKKQSSGGLALVELSSVDRGLMDSMRRIAEGTDFEVNENRNTQQNLRRLMQE